MVHRTCPICASEVTGQKSKIYCSRPCKDKGKPSASGLTCYVCTLPMVKGSTSKPQGSAAHNACEKSCEVCGKTALAQRLCPTHYTAMWRKAFHDENGYWPQRGGRISPKKRLALYERDDCKCYLCGDTLSLDTPFNDPKALTLDHVHPRSRGGTDDPDNLKTCCRECNIKKADSISEVVSVA